MCSAKIIAREMEIFGNEKNVPIDDVGMLEWSESVGGSWSDGVWEEVGVRGHLGR